MLHSYNYISVSLNSIITCVFTLYIISGGILIFLICYALVLSSVNSSNKHAITGTIDSVTGALLICQGTGDAYQ